LKYKETILFKATIFSKDLCPFCSRAKKLLTSKGIKFDEHHIVQEIPETKWSTVSKIKPLADEILVTSNSGLITETYAYNEKSSLSKQDGSTVAAKDLVEGDIINLDTTKYVTRDDLLALAPNASTVPQIWLVEDDKPIYIGGYTELAAFFEK
jgi:glutaredoxin